MKKCPICNFTTSRKNIVYCPVHRKKLVKAEQGSGSDDPHGDRDIVESPFTDITGFELKDD